MGAEGSLLCSQQSANFPCPAPINAVYAATSKLFLFFGLPYQNLAGISLSPMCATYPSHLIVLHLAN